MIDWKIEKRKLNQLMPYETADTGVEDRHNPRLRDPKGYAELKKSIDQIGMAQAINVARASNVILSGHQRVSALIEKFGQDHEVDCYVSSRELTEAEMRDCVILLNKAVAGIWDLDYIADNWDKHDYGRYGFDEPNRAQKGKTDDDHVPTVTNCAVKKGDIFQLGRHRLMCGDSTSLEDIGALMGGARADMVFTDPPYNVDYEGEGKDTARKIANDNMAPEAFRDFLRKAFLGFWTYTTPNAALYCCYASRTHREFEDGLNAAAWQVRSQIIWVKLQASWGFGDYRWKHEPILYCHKKGSSLNFYGDRKQYTEWREHKSDEELLAIMKAQLEKDEKGGSTIWRFGREGNYVHPTQKPVQLVLTALMNSSKPHERVLDLFGGSGSTMIACEKARRVNYSMELDPQFCAVIIKRFEEFTGVGSVKL